MAEKRKRGFAAMDPALVKEIAKKGGQTAHAKGAAHQWTADEARHAGRKGGVTVSQDRDYMAAIGREGGSARRRSREEGDEAVNDGRFLERETAVEHVVDGKSVDETPPRAPRGSVADGPVKTR